MRAPSSDLPLVLDDVTLQAGATTILDRLSLMITPGAPTLIVGPNGSGKSTLLRLCMGLAAPSAGRVSWGGRTDSKPVRRAILFQRPVMLRRTAAANVAYALAQAGAPRKERARACRCIAGTRRAVRSGGPSGAKTVGRRTAAAGAGPRAGARTGNPAARRAHRQPRSRRDTQCRGDRADGGAIRHQDRDGLARSRPGAPARRRRHFSWFAARCASRGLPPIFSTTQGHRKPPPSCAAIS